MRGQAGLGGGHASGDAVEGRTVRTLGKVGAVLAGYAAALAAAAFVVYLRDLGVPAADMQASGGMYAFGDATLFMGTFGLLALAPTGLGLYWLRRFEKLWPVISVGGLALALTGPLAAILAAVARTHEITQTLLLLLVFFALGRVGAAPILTLGFLMAAAVAPSGGARWKLVAAAAIEGAVSLYGFLAFRQAGA